MIQSTPNSILFRISHLKPCRQMKQLPTKISRPKNSDKIPTNYFRFSDARRYFKQSEIVLYRQAPEGQQHLQIDMPSIGGKQPEQSPPVPAWSSKTC